MGDIRLDDEDEFEVHESLGACQRSIFSTIACKIDLLGHHICHAYACAPLDSECAGFSVLVSFHDHAESEALGAQRQLTSARSR